MLILVGSAHAQQSALDTAASLTRNPAIYALLVAQHNNVKYEKYCNGKNANDLFNSQSLTKDVMSLLVGMLSTRVTFSRQMNPCLVFSHRFCRIKIKENNGLPSGKS